MEFVLVSLEGKNAILKNSQDQRITVLKSLLPDDVQAEDIVFVNISNEKKPEAKKMLNELLDIE